MASAVGATVHIHYCMGKVADYGFVHKEEGRCKKCGMKNTEQKKGCCKDEVKTYKTNDHKLTQSSFDISHTPDFVVLNHGYPVRDEHIYDHYSPKSIAPLPPIIRRTCPIYIKVRNFRI